MEFKTEAQALRVELEKLKSALNRRNALHPAVEKYYSLQTAHDLLMHQNRQELICEREQIGFLALAAAKKISGKNMPDGNTEQALPKST
jgi:hypothetical protein